MPVDRLRFVVLGFLLLSFAAHAERVALLEFSGKGATEVRGQIQEGLSKAGVVEVVPASGDVKDAASAKTLAKSLNVATLVQGKVDGDLKFKLIDRTGETLWSKQIALTEGRLSPKDVKRLTRAIGVAAGAKSAPPAAAPPTAVAAAPATKAGGTGGIATAAALGTAAMVGTTAVVATSVPKQTVVAQNGQAEAKKKADADAKAEASRQAAAKQKADADAQAEAARQAEARTVEANNQAEAARQQDEAKRQADAEAKADAARQQDEAKRQAAADAREKAEAAAVASAATAWALNQQQKEEAEQRAAAEERARQAQAQAAGETKAAEEEAKRAQAKVDEKRAAEAALAAEVASNGHGPPPPPPAPPEPPPPPIGPIFELQFSGLVSGRSYCARPGVTHCSDYDRLSSGSRPAGPTADYDPGQAYFGFDAQGSLFPLGSSWTIFRGLGLTGGYARSWAGTQAPGLTAGGEAAQIPVNSIEESWNLMGLWRFYFGWQEVGPFAGYVAVRGGYLSRSFTVDAPASVFLPSTRRQLWGLGLDLRVPIIRWLRVDMSGMYYFTPNVIPEDALALGPVTGGLGLSVSAGLSGEIVGPLGYFAKCSWYLFDDRFGPGGSVWSAGGTSRESVLVFAAGLSLTL